MKLLVCFKMTYDLDDVSAREWNRCLEDTGEPAFFKEMINVFDESALELALRLADDARALGCDAEATALTVGKDLPEIVARNLFAAQFDHVVRVKYDKDLRFHPDITAGIISRFIVENGGFDLILTGRQAGVGDNAITHLLVAETLGLPCVLDIIDAVYTQNGIRAKSIVDEGVLHQTITMPVVLAVGNALHPYLRIATLRERLAASQKCADEIEYKDLQAPDRELSNVLYSGLAREKKHRGCLMIEADTAEEKVRLLYESCLKKVLRA